MRLTEFELPSQSATAQNTIHRLIAVSSGDKITTSGSFSGSMLHGCLDILADGSYLGDRRMEGSRTGEMKFVKSRRLEVKTALNHSEEPRRTSISAPEKIVEGALHVMDLDSQAVTSDGPSTEFGAGCLAVIVSFNQETRDNYSIRRPSMCLGTWQQRNRVETADGGVTPTHKLELRSIPTEVSSTRASRHSRYFKQTRFGTQPWARMVFHYRSISAIHTAGASIAPSVSHALRPHADPSKFELVKQVSYVFAHHKSDWLPNRPSPSTMFKEEEHTTVPTSGTSKKHPPEKIEQLQRKSKLFGNSLNLSGGMASVASDIAVPAFHEHSMEDFVAMLENSNGQHDGKLDCKSSPVGIDRADGSMQQMWQQGSMPREQSNAGKWFSVVFQARDLID